MNRYQNGNREGWSICANVFNCVLASTCKTHFAFGFFPEKWRLVLVLNVRMLVQLVQLHLLQQCRSLQREMKVNNDNVSRFICLIKTDRFSESRILISAFYLELNLLLEITKATSTTTSTTPLPTLPPTTAVPTTLGPTTTTQNILQEAADISGLPTWGVVSIIIAVCTVVLGICFCCIRRCFRKRRAKDGKKGIKGVDLKPVGLIGSSYKEKVGIELV